MLFDRAKENLNMMMNNQQPDYRDRAIDSDVDPGVDPAVELEEYFQSEDPNELQPNSEKRTTDLGNRQILIAHEPGGSVDADFS
jgi:hypothetical protein